MEMGPISVRIKLSTKVSGEQIQDMVKGLTTL